MILDTTYILPVAKIDIDTDLLTLIDEGKVRISMDDIRISMISLFELQARVAKYKLPPKFAIDAVDIVNSNLKIEPFYNPEVIKIADELSRELGDYVDCLIVATAVALKEDLVTEDREINKKKTMIESRYKIKIFGYKDMVVKG